MGFGPGNGITVQDLLDNADFYGERVESMLARAARWQMAQTRCDGFRLDAVKHVPADFFGATYGEDKDRSDYGYTGQIQRQFNLTHGYSDANHRDTVFDTQKPRDDAMIFGEHLGQPPSYQSYIDAGMRLVDNELRNQLNGRLGNPSADLYGFDQPGWGGFSARVFRLRVLPLWKKPRAERQAGDHDENEDGFLSFRMSVADQQDLE